MTKSRILTTILLLTIFILGLIAGVFLGSSRFARFFRHRRPREERILQFIIRRYERKLNLTSEQKNRLITILKKHRAEINHLARKVQPEFEKIRKQTNSEIKNILNEEQKKIFEKMQNEFFRPGGKFARVRPEGPLAGPEPPLPPAPDSPER